MEDVWEIANCPNELQQKKIQLKTLDTYCIYEKKKLNAFDIHLHELSIYKLCSISPTLPPFGVTNSINERLFKKCIFSFLLILGCLKIKSQRLASSQQKFKRSQDTHKKTYSKNKNILNPRTPSHSKTMTNHGEKPCKQCYRHIDD